MITESINSVLWAHIVSTGEIVYGYTIEQVLSQLPDDFYGPIYERYSWPMTWALRDLGYMSHPVFEVLP